MENEKKFGLFINAKSSKSNNTLKNKTFVQNFNSGESDGESEGEGNILKRDSKSQKNTNRSIMMQQIYNSNKLSNEISKHLLEDPNVYEYDSLYDEVSSVKKKPANKSTTQQDDKPKLLGAIMAQTQKRKIERSIIQERMEKKRREREQKDLGEQPKFITKAYEQKLLLNKKNEMSLALHDKEDEKKTINSETGMMGFYSNLLTKNTAYAGGRRGEGDTKNDVDSNYLKVYQEKKKQYEKVVIEDEDEIERGKNKKDKDIKLKKDTFNEDEEKSGDNNISQKNKSSSSITKTESSKQIGNTFTLDDYKQRYLERKRNRTDNK